MCQWIHYVIADGKYEVLTARLAQSVEHETLNLRVVGSSPTLGDILALADHTVYCAARLKTCTNIHFNLRRFCALMNCNLLGTISYTVFRFCLFTLLLHNI